MFVNKYRFEDQFFFINKLIINNQINNNYLVYSNC